MASSVSPLFGSLRRHQGFEQAVFRVLLGAVGDQVQLFFADHFDGHLDQVADHGIDIAPHVAHFGEFRGFDLDEGRVRQAGQAARDLRLADAGGAHHQDVLGHDLFGHFGGELLAADAVAQGDGDGALGLGLADDVLVKLLDDFTGREFVECGRFRVGLPG